MSAKRITLILFTVLNLSLKVRGADFFTEQPSFLPPCRINEPDFTKCSTNSIQKLMDQMAIGIPEIVKAIGPFDPLNVRDVIFKQDNAEVVTITANLTEMQARGFGKTQIKESKVSKEDGHWETKVFLPKLRLDANYEMAGRILLIPLQGKGKMFIEIENMEIFAYTSTHIYRKGDFSFFNVTGVRVDLNMTRVRCNFGNLFNGKSKEIEASTNEFFNENWRDFYEALKPMVLTTVESLFFEVLSKVFEIIPLNFFVEDFPTPEKLYGTKDKT